MFHCYLSEAYVYLILYIDSFLSLYVDPANKCGLQSRNSLSRLLAMVLDTELYRLKTFRTIRLIPCCVIHQIISSSDSSTRSPFEPVNHMNSIFSLQVRGDEAGQLGCLLNGGPWAQQHLHCYAHMHDNTKQTTTPNQARAGWGLGDRDGEGLQSRVLHPATIQNRTR